MTSPADKDLERLEDLLDHWEDEVRAGRDVNPGEVCRDCPEFANAVAIRAAALRRMRWVEREAVGPDDHPGGSPTTWVAGSEPVPGYRLTRRLGRGGSGEVWAATGPGGVAVAVKAVPADRPLGRAERRAVEVVKGLRHPHLLGLHAVWDRPGLLVIASELADGSLAGRGSPTASGSPSASDVLGWVRDAADGLDYLNAAGVVHRDVKPANLLLVGGRVKVGDPGLARSLGDGGHSGPLTVGYAPPEFYRGKTAERSD